MSAGRGRRRATPGARDAIGRALQAWRDHSAHCHQCHSNAGHPGLYCAAGFDLAQHVAQERAKARAAAEIRKIQQGGLW